MNGGWLAGATVFVGALTAIVTNLVTDRWSWTLAATLVALIAVGILLAVLHSGRLDTKNSAAGPTNSGTYSAKQKTLRIDVGGDYVGGDKVAGDKVAGDKVAGDKHVRDADPKP